MKTAIVHYWLTGMRGGEKVVEELCEMYPKADIFTLVLDKNKISDVIKSHKIITSFLQNIGGVRWYKKMLPIMPIALEALDLTGYDLVISSESGPAKGVITKPDSIHICYCHSPMRYIWDLERQYLQEAGFLSRILMRLFGPILRQWDVTTSHRVDYFVANSSYVASRIKKYYRRDAVVIHPPVSIEKFSKAENVEDVYISAGQITPYKKIDLCVDAFTKMGKRLDVIGAGAPDWLKKRAGPTVRFLGALSDSELADRFSTAKALVFPGIEDFGIIPLEVMACGRPVIAYAKGGAIETVEDGKTGLLFFEQDAQSIIDAVNRFERIEDDNWNYEYFRNHVHKFSKEMFRKKMSEFITGVSMDAETMKML